MVVRCGVWIERLEVHIDLKGKEANTAGWISELGEFGEFLDLVNLFAEGDATWFVTGPFPATPSGLSLLRPL